MNLEINSVRKARAHTVYKNAAGQRLPGVTTITNVLNKPALILWANKLGLQGVEVDKYVDDLADIGTLAHYMVECHIRREKTNLDDYSKNQISSAETCFLKYLEWERHHSVEPLGSEMQLVSEQYQYGGTLDLFVILDGVRTLIDLKTCKVIYPDHFLQVGGGYMLLADENRLNLRAAGILRIGRSDDEGLNPEFKEIPKIKIQQELFLKCLEIFNLKKQLNF